MLENNAAESSLDRALARFLSRRAGLDAAAEKHFEKLITQLSFELSQGHNCLAIDAQDRALLLATPLAGEPPFAGAPRPLVIERNRLYLHRYWAYERRLAEKIKTMLDVRPAPAGLDPLLARYFAPSSDPIDWQRAAAEKAARQAFTIITGGPGTGKTTTVVKILALLQELAPEPLYVALAAPTGKAAMRLKESIGLHKAALPCAEQIKAHIPETVTTLHRLLGAQPPSPYFRHDANNPLAYDLVVVDEASMIDLALMAKLLAALKPGARLILLGDKDQLASVESGAVLADLCQALPEHTLELKTAHRFNAAIKRLATLVNQQQSEDAWQMFENGTREVSLLHGDLIDAIAAKQAAYLRLQQAGASFEAVRAAHGRFQVLCSNRQGKNGVTDLNARVEQKLLRDKLIGPTGPWYAGRPVMVTQNHPSLHLYNGDIGICLHDPAQHGRLMVFFEHPGGEMKKYLPSRLPAVETAFAMTVHKSQGSEFDEVLIALPGEINPVLTKELLYTAITRAKKTVALAADGTVFKTAVKQKISRVTGLVDKFIAT